MKRTLFSIIIVILGLIGLAAAAQAQTAIQIGPDQSIGVLSEPPASGEQWSTTVFPFGNYTGTVSLEPVFCRTYLRFPLDGIPGDATLHAATLYVYVDDYWPQPGGAPMSIYPAGGQWPSGDAWNDMVNWPVLGPAVTTTTVSSDGGWFAWDVTALVQGWLAGTPNQGLAVAAADLGSTATNWATARRLSAGDPDTRPYLEVDYTTPPPPTSTPRPTSPPQPQPTSPPPPAPTPTAVPVILPPTGTQPSLSALWVLAGGAALLALGLAWRTCRQQT